MKFDLDDLDTIAKYMRYGPSRKDNRRNANEVFINLRELEKRYLEKALLTTQELLNNARNLKTKKT